MKALLQRVRRASVEVEGQCVGKIEQGLLVFLGLEKEGIHFLHCLGIKVNFGRKTFFHHREK